MGWIPGSRAAALTTTLLCLLPAVAQARPVAGPEGRLGDDLRALVRADAEGDPVGAVAASRQVTVTPGERVLVEVYGTSSRTGLRDAGAEVLATAPGPSGLTVASAWVPVDALRDLAGTPGVRAVLPVVAGGSDAGAVTSQGDAAHRGPQARALGVTGAGVKVGVISDSIDQRSPGIAGSQASGDLPAQVTVLSDHANQSDEGRAMAEIVYDTAPGITQMAFASGTKDGAPGKAQAIDDLVRAGAKIIADDIFYLSEPFFQDGQVARAVDRARDAGVLYLASAGNRARQSYESTPRLSGPDPADHDFDPGDGVDTVQTLATVPAGRFIQLVLQWDEAWGQARSDIDVTLVRTDTGAIVANAVSDNIQSGIPLEVATWTNTSAAPVQVALRIQRWRQAAGAPAVTRLKHIVRGGGPGGFPTFTIAEHDTSSDTINPDAAAARGALAVAAVFHGQEGLNRPEPFSSRGPKTRLFGAGGARLTTPEIRQKPELAAADGISTSVTGFTTFFGTSAAVPSAAGLAALAWSADLSLPLTTIRTALTNPAHAIACIVPADCGSGFVLADRVVASLDATPPQITAVVPDPDGADGWHRRDVPVSWTVTDAGSTPTIVSGCASTTVVVDGQTTLSCRASSTGGTAERSVTIRRDATPPAIPRIGGIAATTYPSGAVPPASAITCASSDATSGLLDCTVTGYSASPGTHTLRAVAGDVAGLTSASTLTYRVEAPPAIAAAPTVSGPVAPAAAGPLVPALGPAAGVAPARLVRLPSARRCVRSTTRMTVRIVAPQTGAIRRTTVRMTGRRDAIARTRAGTIRLPRLARARVTVRVTVTLADGRSASVARTYRRC